MIGWGSLPWPRRPNCPTMTTRETPKTTPIILFILLACRGVSRTQVKPVSPVKGDWLDLPLFPSHSPSLLLSSSLFLSFSFPPPLLLYILLVNELIHSMKGAGDNNG
jgi:hypothetical protein